MATKQVILRLDEDLKDKIDSKLEELKKDDPTVSLNKIGTRLLSDWVAGTEQVQNPNPVKSLFGNPIDTYKGNDGEVVANRWLYDSVEDE